MRTLSALLLSFVIFLLGTKVTKAQTIELLAGNTLNGAVNGTLLGGASMGLQNDDNFRHLQIGLGLGTLYGLGMGAYDVALGSGDPVYVSGLFNDGNNTSIIILLDTFYGAAAGAIIGTSVMLVADRPIVEGLQYGASAGAWVGFGVGLVDVFGFTERQATTPLGASYQPNQKASGLVGIQIDDSKSIGLINPTITNTISAKENSLSRKFTPTVELLNIKLSF
ncbi:hypothetical protein [Gracilimonas tropica]|uniref:hypothetical protein n=1 Tax=Gracilimonas tropica TaxID=454600 RepID=UPI00036CE1FB|nr:hypothetical protein [Gracilimonas tropica]